MALFGEGVVQKSSAMALEYRIRIPHNRLLPTTILGRYTEGVERRSTMIDGLITVAALSPGLRVADPSFNGKEIVAGIEEAAKQGVCLLVLPELCTTGSTCGDLFHSQTLLKASDDAVRKIVGSTTSLQLIVVFGAPVVLGSNLYNASIVAYDGQILAIVPKPAAGVFASYEGEPLSVELFDAYTYFGNGIRIAPSAIPHFVLAIDDFKTPGSATVVASPISEAELIGRSTKRRLLAQGFTISNACALVQANSGEGESTTDSVYLADALIVERGKILSESGGMSGKLVIGQIDLQVLVHQRRLEKTFPLYEEGCLEIPCDLVHAPSSLIRHIDPFPFVPHDQVLLKERCEEVLTLQALGLKKRLEHIGIKRVILGLSGGLDSTAALLAVIRTFDVMSLDRGGIIAVSMPGFGTTSRTKSNAQALAEALSVTFFTIPIEKAVTQHFKDIDHDPTVLDITYENAQARERTQVLMDLANKHGALVIGTGDLSELALGWTTYNGDHMSMYAINSSVPKTLLRPILAHEANEADEDLQAVLLDILSTPVSPELLPPSGDGAISQKTEAVIGPYELHDFFLYYTLRWGFGPWKIHRFAVKAFEGSYTPSEISRWLGVFFTRFIANQFKRSASPDGPAVGSVSLSPRTGFRAPSDAQKQVWIEEIAGLMD